MGALIVGGGAQLPLPLPFSLPQLPLTCCMNLCFYPRDAMLARVIAIATCLSVRLSRAGIVSKRRKLAA